MTRSQRHHSGKHVVLALLCLVGGYLAAALAGWPQQATARIAARPREVPAAQHTASLGSEAPTGPHGGAAACPPIWMILPFALLLAAIAAGPLTPLTAHWWESNLHKFYASGALSLVVLAYYVLFCRRSVPGHWPIEHLAVPAPGGLGWNLAGTVLSNAILGEYLPFIALLFSLYVIAGGIRIEGDLPAHPLTNTAFLGVGVLLASVIGTTGAAMLLIRPLLESNRERKHVRHTVIVFIFAVCNCGGCLLPLGDPPLFLGYLFGVPFFWTLKLWPAWLLVNGLLLAIYFLWDHFWYYPREAARDIACDETQRQPLRFRGLGLNAFLLAGVVLAVALLDPSKPLPAAAWHPWIYLRETVQLGLVAMSLVWTAPAVRRDNDFSYGAILEVAALFLGIFICMQPPLEILHAEGPSLGLSTPLHFFWAGGGLSAVLDNAPTYGVFFETARSLGGSPAVAGVQESLLTAVSLGSVFMGAMTYIGNGPNFMVKSIAEKSGVAMPGFFGFVVYSSAILLPILVLVAVLFV